jgi:hypothetical protein
MNGLCWIISLSKGSSATAISAIATNNTTADNNNFKEPLINRAMAFPSDCSLACLIAPDSVSTTEKYSRFQEYLPLKEISLIEKLLVCQD